MNHTDHDCHAWRVPERVCLTLCFPRSQCQCSLHRDSASRSCVSGRLGLGLSCHFSQRGTTLSVPGQSWMRIMPGEQHGYMQPGSLQRPAVTALKHRSERGAMSVVVPYQGENQNHVRNQNENKFWIGVATQQCSCCPEPTSEGEGQKAWLSCETSSIIQQ